MDTKPQTPTGADGDDNNLDKSVAPSTEPAPLANYDFDRELDPAPITPGPLLKQSIMQGSKSDKKGSKKTLAMVILTVLLLVAVAAAGYFYWQTMEAQKQADAAHVQLQAANVENIKLKNEAAKADVATDTPKTLTPAEQTAADKAAITGVITAKLHAPTKSKDEKLTINVMKQNAQFAYVNAGPATGGAAAYILKKADDVWSVVYSGQEKVSAEVVEQYSIPTEFQSGQ